ncbi:outer membrane protein assembly factor BamE domain-containing protein [Natronogracilivirga saccharolytica]|uniref:Outer membrane protein assembly factor BamE n=1 Tax=Natronogracilivirga saccharolytica TaxID=2812953 RepID=A0A8J7RN24_9BACT|nr:outer membrane protein assembly factor BamE [Natronogracilivirga saccharolytica]MBP3194010.1 outer membrane protein assembly factor BamE [Natronogracilivirga saccharolytica]
MNKTFINNVKDMKLAHIFVLLVFLCFSQKVLGQQNNNKELDSRITELEQVVASLQQRIIELETIVQGQQESGQPVAAKGNWQELRNWRQLQRGMTMQQVEELLGEPEKVNAGGTLTFWYWDYPGGPQVSFDRSNKVYGWSEPSR